MKITGRKYSRVAEQDCWTHAHPAGLRDEMNLFQKEGGSIDYGALGLVLKLSPISRFATHICNAGPHKLVFHQHLVVCRLQCDGRFV